MYANENRLPMRVRRHSANGVSVTLPDGFNATDIQEVVGDYFDDVLDLEVVE